MTVGAREWILVLVVAPVLLALELFVLPRDAALGRRRTAVAWATGWTLVGAAFGLLVWADAGEPYAIKYFTGFVLEKGLTLDQVLVFTVILARFGRRPTDARRLVFVALWAGVLVRVPFVALGSALAEADQLWLSLPLSALLLVAAGLLVRHRERHPDPHQLWSVRRLVAAGRVDDRWVGDELLVRDDRGRRVLTLGGLLLVALLTADLFFAAVVPLAFAYTKPAFLVLASDVFALLGFRSLYAAVARLEVDSVRLKVGLAVVLALIAVHLVVHPLLGKPTWFLPVVGALVIGVPLLGALHRARGGEPVRAAAPGGDA